MPPVRAITLSSNQFQVSDLFGVKTIVFTNIPPNFNNAAKVENFFNNTWVPANISGYQMVCHVLTFTPLSIAIWTGNIGVSIPPNWWLAG